MAYYNFVIEQTNRFKTHKKIFSPRWMQDVNANASHLGRNVKTRSLHFPSHILHQTTKPSVADQTLLTHPYILEPIPLSTIDSILLGSQSNFFPWLFFIVMEALIYIKFLELHNTKAFHANHNSTRHDYTLKLILNTR